MNWSQIKGQENVKRAVEVASAGKHSIMLIGAPGTGKTAILSEFYDNIIEYVSKAEWDAVSARIDSGEPVAITMTACPCGHYNNPKQVCECERVDIEKHLNQVPGTLIDRIEVVIEVTPPKSRELLNGSMGESTEAVKERIMGAVKGSDTKICTASKELLKMALDKLGLSARQYNNSLRVARTIANLAHSQQIRPEHIAEAIQYQSYNYHTH